MPDGGVDIRQQQRGTVSSLHLERPERQLEGQRNTAFGNAIYENGALGIDTGSSGLNPINNDGDPAEQATANRGLNWPVLTSASGGANSGVVQGTLFSIDGDYTLQVFSASACNALGHGDARRYHTSDSVTISGAAAGENGIAQFSVPVSRHFEQPRD